MAWSWSHTEAAYRSAELRLRALPVETLVEIYGEWRACQSKGGIIRDTDDFCMRKYRRAVAYAAKLPDDLLADFIWERASEFATCDNGGFRCWLCPSGCHTVSFDSLDDEELCEDE